MENNYPLFLKEIEIEKEKRETISYNEVVSLFDPDVWDVSILTEQDLRRVANYPIKSKNHNYGLDYTSIFPYDHEFVPTLTLARKGWSWDYTHYLEAEEIFKSSRFDKWASLYINFKEAAIISGLGVRARNGLVYNYRFGFDVHYAAIGLAYNITDFPEDRRTNLKLWNRCTDCYDCVNACPAKAIHAHKNQKEPYWLDLRACDSMIGFGNEDYPDIPSVKDFWQEHVYPELPSDVVNDIRNAKDLRELTGKEMLPFDKNGVKYDGQVMWDNDGDAVNVPFCRECTSQPRCSQWNGKFPYDKVKGKIKYLPEFEDKFTHNKNKK